MPPADEDTGAGNKARCPICSAPSDPVVRPFCSTRCANVDLLRWLRGAYAIPVVDADDDEDGERTASPDMTTDPRADAEPSTARSGVDTQRDLLARAASKRSGARRRDH